MCRIELFVALGDTQVLQLVDGVRTKFLCQGHRPNPISGSRINQDVEVLKGRAAPCGVLRADWWCDFTKHHHAKAIC